MKYKMISKKVGGEFNGHKIEAENLTAAKGKICELKGVIEHPTIDDYDIVEYVETRGRPPKFEKTTIMSIRIPTDLYDKIPERKSEFVRGAVKNAIDILRQ